MSTVISRKVASIPTRTAGETWQAIVELVSAPGSAARTTLESAAGVASMLISEEYSRSAPIVVLPSTGPRVRIYTLHGSVAIEGEDTNEVALPGYPTSDAGWSLSMPCAQEDLAVAKSSVSDIAAIDVRDIDEAVESAPAQVSAARGAFLVNLEDR